MERITTTYRPSVHGFRFHNDWHHQIIFEGLSTWGRCNGIAHVSCDYFYAGRAAPDVGVVNYGVAPRSGLAAARWDAGRCDLLCRGGGDHLATRVFRHGQWSAWEKALHCEFAAGPGAASAAPEQLDVLLRDRDRKVRHYRWTGANGAMRRPCTPLPYGALDTQGMSDVSPAVAAMPGRVECYARGLDGSLWFSHTDERTGEIQWQPWHSVGHPDGVQLDSAPAAACAPGWSNAVVRGSDGALWHRQ